VGETQAARDRDRGTDHGLRRRGRAARRAHEDVLLRRYAETRSEAVREQLIECFIPLARSLAARYRGGSEPLEDLIGVANIGLLKAIDGFDPDRRRPFTAYAVPTILGELRRHFRDHVWSLRLPRGLGEMTMAVDETVARLTEELGHTPSVTEIADALEISEEAVLEAMHAAQARRILSLDVPVVRGDDESAPAVESVESFELGYDGVEARMAAREAGLEPREWWVLRLKFVDGLTQYEIAERLGVSQMQISRVMRRALRKLLDAVRGRELEAV
jgi:RNA polymerase sigma-B factor